MSSPWGKIEKLETVDFQDILSEEYARELQDKENRKFGQHLAGSQQIMSLELMAQEENNKSNDDAIQEGNSSKTRKSEDFLPADILEAIEDDIPLSDYCDSDRIIAEMLQAQFDRDHDIELKRIEKQCNKDAKVSISFSKYRTIPDDLLYDSEEEEPDDPKEWDRFVANEKQFNSMSKKGFTYDKDGIKVTKHDEQLNSVRNACRAMDFPPEFSTGDAAGFDIKLPNSVFNQLKTYSQKSKRNKAQDRRENVATAEMGIDERTRIILYKLTNNQILEVVNGIISTGKEAVILHADSDSMYDGELVLPKECAVKIFKTTLNEFKQRDRYIKDDYRFKDRFSKQNNRVIINMWAEKEMHNLMRMKSSGINCPEVVTLKKHVLVMSFIGENGEAAPKIKDVLWSEAEAIVAYEEVIGMMYELYNRAKLVHADLSEYNILWYQDRCWFIDVAQSVEPDHPSALEFMMRDCNNISTVII